MRWLISLSSASNTLNFRWPAVDFGGGAFTGGGEGIGTFGTVTGGGAGAAGRGIGRLGGVIAAASAAVALPNLAVNQNRLPSPALLSIPSSPPISSASCFEIERPRPVPPY